MGAVYGREYVTNLMNSKVTQSQTLSNVAPSNSVFGDSWPGVHKTLTVVYKHEGYDPNIVIVREHGSLNLNIPSRSRGSNAESTYSGNNLRIIGAAYGLADVTYHVQSMVRNNRLDVSASNSVFGDTYGGVRKTLVVVYRFGNGPYRTRFVTEWHTLHIS